LRRPVVSTNVSAHARAGSIVLHSSAHGQKHSTWRLGKGGQHINIAVRPEITAQDGSEKREFFDFPNLPVEIPTEIIEWLLSQLEDQRTRAFRIPSCAVISGLTAMLMCWPPLPQTPSGSVFDHARMSEELSTLLGREADVVETTGLRNPFRRHEILGDPQSYLCCLTSAMLLLWDMREAARDCIEFVTAATYEEFCADRMMHSAVERRLEILGEAAGRVSKGFNCLIQRFLGKEIKAIRVILAHRYGDVNLHELGRPCRGICQTLLPKLDVVVPSIENP